MVTEVREGLELQNKNTFILLINQKERQTTKTIKYKDVSRVDSFS